MYTVQLIQSTDKLLLLEKEWKILLTQSTFSSVYVTFEWILSWWESFGGDKELFVIALYEKNTLVALAPLMLARTSFFGLSFRTISFIGTPQADYMDVLLSPSCAQEKVASLLWECIQEHAKTWDLVQLQEIPSTSFFFPFLRSHYTQALVMETPCYAYNICPSSSPTELFSKIKKNILNKVKRGEIQLSFFESVDVAEKALPHFFELHIKRMRSLGLESQFCSSENKKFYTLLVRRLFEQGWISFSQLTYQNATLAYDFSFIYNNIYFGYTGAIDSSYRSLSPGLLNLKFLMEYAYAQKLDAVDFTRGGESYKLPFVNTHKKNYTLLYWKSPFVRVVYAFVKYCAPYIRKISFLNSIIDKKKYGALS